MNILNEDATTNLCSNPSAETNTANITKVNGTGTSSVTRTNEQAWSGNYSFKFEVTSGTIEAYRVGVMPPASTGQTFTSSAWMYVQSGGFRVRVAFRDSGGTVVGGQSGVYNSATGGWVRLSTTATAPANTATVEIIIGANASGIAYIDALQL